MRKTIIGAMMFLPYVGVVPMHLAVGFGVMVGGTSKALDLADNNRICRVMLVGDMQEATLSQSAMSSGSGCTPELAIALVSAAHRAGVTISAGTDTYAPEDDDYPALHLELERLVDSGVMTPAEALVAATANGARALGREEDYGTIEPDKLAGIVVLENNPLEDIRALRSVKTVIKRDRVYQRDDFQWARPPVDQP